MATSAATAVPSELLLSDGARVTVGADVLELRDERGALLIRYQDGHAEVHAPRGDLTLAAPGRVTLRSGTDICIEAEGATRVRSARIDVQAERSDIKLGRATLVARHIATTASSLALHVDRYELTANRLVEHARDAFRDVTDLLQTRVGRMRTIVEDTASLSSRRTVMVSKDDTKIDGKRILLG